MRQRVEVPRASLLLTNDSIFTGTHTHTHAQTHAYEGVERFIMLSLFSFS